MYAKARILEIEFMQRYLIVMLLLWPASWSVAAAETPLTPQQFESLKRLIQPQPNESQWAAVPWMINLKDARERPAREGKPLFFWRSGEGDVLGRT